MGKTQIGGGQIKDGDITSDDIADAAVRGTTANTEGTQREIEQGTISTPDLRNDAVDATKLLETDAYVVGSLTATTDVTAKNLIVTVVTSDPESPVEGQVIYNSTVHQLKLYNGTNWVLLG
jgi:hypothetical protein